LNSLPTPGDRARIGGVSSFESAKCLCTRSMGERASTSYISRPWSRTQVADPHGRCGRWTCGLSPKKKKKNSGHGRINPLHMYPVKQRDCAEHQPQNFGGRWTHVGSPHPPPPPHPSPLCAVQVQGDHHRVGRRPKGTRVVVRPEWRAKVPSESANVLCAGRRPRPRRWIESDLCQRGECTLWPVQVFGELLQSALCRILTPTLHPPT
jgi:hypothetical protein